jgi:hypothetical protein
MMGRDLGGWGGGHEATLGGCLNMPCNVGKTLGEIFKMLVFWTIGEHWKDIKRQ